MSYQPQSSEDSPARKDLFSIPEAANYTGLSPSSLWRYIGKGRLPKVQHGGSGSRVMLRRIDLVTLTAASTAIVPGPAPAAVAPGPSKLSGRTPAWKSAALNK
jgi:predicted DNA-binding transcriptional regulator AlpA